MKFNLDDKVICCNHSLYEGEFATIIEIFDTADEYMICVNWEDSSITNPGEFFAWRFRHITKLDKILK